MSKTKKNALRSMYSNFPTQLQTLAVSLVGANIKRKRHSNIFNEYRDKYHNHQWESRDYWQKYQKKRFEKILSLARNQTNHYKEYPNVNIDIEQPIQNQLFHLPILRESIIKESPSDLITDQSKIKNSITLKTSGTTGSPKQTYHTAASQSKYWAAMDRFWRRGGCTYGDRRASFTGNKIVPTNQTKGPYGRIDHANNRLLLSSYHLGDNTVEDYLDLIDEFDPKFIDGYPSAIKFCAQHAIKSGRNIRIPACFPTSEMLREKDKKIIEDGFSTRVYNQYGSTESAGLITECPHGNMHVNPEIGIVEVINEDGQPVEGDNEIGEIVLTGISNKLMPLIRYNIGDLARGPPRYDECDCGWSMPVISEIIGRQDEVVITENGMRIPMLSYNVFKNKKGVKQAQIIQQDHTQFKLKIVPEKNYNEKVEQNIINELKNKVGDVNVGVEKVNNIDRTNNGKFRAVISDVDP